MSQRVGVALVGCGTVGGSTAALLLDQEEKIHQRSGVHLELRYIVDKNFDVARSLELPETLFTEDLDTALSDPEVQIVIELVGGTGFALELSRRVLKAGKHLVTANKALLAHHGAELFPLAEQNGCSIGFEASCGGGIPLVRTLYDGLMANTIDAIYGIVNGTCNYILTEMIEKGQSYDDALAQAQADGLAEADPTLDVAGIDSAHKICIMASLAFGATVDLDRIPVAGINRLQAEDVAYGNEMGYVIKLIASAVQTNRGCFVRVEPAFISMDHPLAWVGGSFNAVSIYGHAVGHTMYYGRGAGGSPTASAVAGDCIAIAGGAYPIQFKQINIWQGKTKPATQLDPAEIHQRYYLRLMVQDKPGNLGRITTVLGSKGISLSSIMQHEIPESIQGDSNEPGSVPIVITTHRVKEADLHSAIREIENLAAVQPGSAVIPIIDEHPEFREF
ncbi:homoserine dehydrogenase [Spirochaeta lutea]|uniref:Homoserine dehydrogenase n=1 Tax=Spirochaeta lutea TaxID=1480694 RepID=A0A098QVP0_9SPIO|nr:homoserine dehydrogenase [Spirochaeta lutea]KGE71646.1 homoserine dehydrogenase [Spirochaeta lutea]